MGARGEPGSTLDPPVGVESLLGELWGRSSTERCGFVAAMSLVFTGLYWLIGEYALARPDVMPFVDLGFLRRLETGLLGFAGLWATVLVAALALRRRSPENRPLVHATIQLYALTSSLGAWALGVATTPFGVVLLAAVLMGSLIFKQRDVLYGVVTGAATLTATTFAEARGWLRYAPIFSAPPYVNGRLSPVWKGEMIGVAIASSLVLVGVFASLVRRLRDREARLEALAHTDALTGVANRRYFMETLARELRRAERTGRPLACALLDIDHFKSINDQHGHLVGDRVLVVVGEVLGGALRTNDTVARYGGEEFAVLLPDTDLEGARVVAERCRAAIESGRVVSGGVAVRCTASLGVACTETAPAARPEDLLKRADAALYRAKHEGRNRLAVAT